MTLPPRIKPKSTKEGGPVRCPAHLKWVRSHACCIPGCRATDIEAAHVRTGTDGGMGMKPGDEWTISLCRNHHQLQHIYGESEFCAVTRINMHDLAKEFAAKSAALQSHIARKKANER